VPQPGSLHRLPHAAFDVGDALLPGPIKARRLEGDARAGNINPPALFTKVRDQQADRPQIRAFAVVHITPGQFPQLRRKRTRQSGVDPEEIVKRRAAGRR